VVNSRFLQTCRPAICDGLLARLEGLVGRLADPWCYGWGRQLLGCRRPCDGTASPTYWRRDTVLAATSTTIRTG